MIQPYLIAALCLLFLWSLWRGKEIPVPFFLLLLVALSLCQTTLFIDYRRLSGLFFRDDFPKYFTYTLDNLHALLRYGTPFGYNHYFQGGIPELYLTSTFLEVLPFSLIFGEAMGYQLMLIFFIVLTPVTLFFLARQVTGEGTASRILGVAATFQLGLWPILQFGMVPALISMPLSFLSLLFFLRYLAGKRHSLFPLLFFTALLVYTHIVIWANTMMFFLMIVGAQLIAGKKRLALLKRPAVFGILHIVIGLPVWTVFFGNLDFFRTDWVNFTKMPGSFYLRSIPRRLVAMARPRNIFFLSILVLLWGYFQSRKQKTRQTLLHVALFSFGLYVLLSLIEIPQTRLFIDKFDWMFVPFAAAFNLSLIFLLQMRNRARVFGFIILMLLLFQYYPMWGRRLQTIASFSRIDTEISHYVRRRDYVLLENCAHAARYGTCPYSHWLGYLQRALGAKFFSHQGNDAQPYNALRSMYLANGYFLGRPLGKDNGPGFIAHLRDWSVNKVCVWSEKAKEFFASSSEFKLLGQSKKYTCYAATYSIPPPVRLDGGGRGRIVEENPVSFTLLLEDVSRPQTVTINKNFFRAWSAYDGGGRKIPLKECGQKICFQAGSSGYIYFKYKKNRGLNLIVLLVLLSSLGADFIRPKRTDAQSRTGE
jgi:hypothetical protein